MREISNKDLALIEKYCGHDCRLQLQGVMNNQRSSVIRVVNTGMVSSGKSSLYNILIGSIEDEHFPTGSARTTVSADSFISDGIEYIDTPGIDVKEEDDETAFRTIMESDIVVMVHNIKTGPLIANEITWLSRIANWIKDSQQIQKRLIFICTWKDARERETDYDSIIEDVRKAVFDTVGTDIAFFTVSAKKYLDGRRKCKEALCTSSGVPELSVFIKRFADEYAAIKQERIAVETRAVLSRVKSQLTNVRNNREKQSQNKRDEVKRRFSSLRGSWLAVFDYFKKLRKSYDTDIEEYKSEADELPYNLNNALLAFINIYQQK